MWIFVEDKLVKMTIRDDGPGAAELRDSLFDPFVSDKPSGVGTGLGLYVAQQIIEGAGGQIGLAEVSGASFIATLPRRLADIIRRGVEQIDLQRPKKTRLQKEGF